MPVTVVNRGCQGCQWCQGCHGSKKYTVCAIASTGVVVRCGFLLFSANIYSRSLGWLENTRMSTQQLISKQICRAVTSPKKQTKRTQDSILSAFCSIFGRSYDLTTLFQVLLTFSNKILFLNPLCHKFNHCGLPPLRNAVHYCLKLARKIFPISSDEEPFCQHTTVLA